MLFVACLLRITREALRCLKFGDGTILDRAFDDLSLHDLYRVVLRHKKKCAVFFLVVCFSAFTLAVILPARYASESKLLLLVGRESVTLDPVVSTGSKVMNLEASRAVELTTVGELMNSRETLAQVVDELGADFVLQPPPSPGVYDYTTQLVESTTNGLKTRLKSLIGSQRPIGKSTAMSSHSKRDEEAIEKLQDAISIQAGKTSSVITVEAVARSPDMAQTLASTLVNVYTRHHAQLHTTGKSEEFFSGQKELIESKLRSKRDRLSELKVSMGIGSIESEFLRLEADKARIATLRGSLQREVAGTQARCEALQSKINSEEELILTERSEGMANGAVDGIRQQLYQLEATASSSANLYNENHPKMKAIRQQLAEMREKYESEAEGRTELQYGRNLSREALNLELQQQRAKEAELAAQIRSNDEQWKQILTSLEKLNGMSDEIAQLTQDIGFLVRSYDTYSDSLEQSRIGNQLNSQQISNINVAQPATYVTEPDGPKRTLIVIAGLIAATMGIVPLAFLSEYLDGRIKSRGELELVTGLPVMSSIPKQSTPLVIPQMSGGVVHDS